MTSLTDVPYYREFCQKAATDDDAFKSFRSDEFYNQVLDHLQAYQGQMYLNEIDDPDILDNLREFQKNDLYGSPSKASYEQIKNISPTTLRYVYVLHDIKKRIGSLDNKKIVEIGTGYGGQCRIICSYYKPHSYILIDLPEVIELAKKYLSMYKIKTPLTFITQGDLPALQRSMFDLAISNYAFSEMNRETQVQYVENVLLRCMNGYMQCNNVTPREFNSMRAPDLIDMIPGLVAEPEHPETGFGNYLVTWRGNDRSKTDRPDV